MKTTRGCLLIATTLFTSIGFGLPQLNLSPSQDCDPATQACLYVSTNIQGVQLASYNITANETVELAGQKITQPVNSTYSNTTDYLWMTIGGVVDKWIVDFTSFTVSSAGVNTKIPDIKLCQGLLIPTNLGKHYLQINGTMQSINCFVQ